jgi:hypothetical protein
MFAAKAFTIASLILVGAKAFEVSTPSNVAEVRIPPVFSGLAHHLTISLSFSAVILRSVSLVQLVNTTSRVSISPDRLCYTLVHSFPTPRY